MTTTCLFYDIRINLLIDWITPKLGLIYIWYENEKTNILLYSEMKIEDRCDDYNILLDWWGYYGYHILVFTYLKDFVKYVIMVYLN